jgi:transposase
MSKPRRFFAPQQKLELLRLNLLNGIAVSELCERRNISSAVFYRWRNQLVQNGAGAFWPQRARGMAQPKPAKPQFGRVQNVHTRQDEADREWMLRLAQGKMDVEDISQVVREPFGHDDIAQLLDAIHFKPLKYRNRAIAVLAFYKRVRVALIARFIGVSHSTVDNAIHKFDTHGCELLLNPFRSNYRKTKDKVYRDAVFRIIHSPPSSYGICRTTWKLRDLHSIMSKQGRAIARNNISKIIRDAGYRYRKAKKVLTSSDPEYGEKLKEITRILSNLGPKEKFFSVDEFGPFAVRIHGGRSLVPRGQVRIVPQRQRSKGCLIVTGALELSTNQMTHFYSKKKNTLEMVKLLDILIRKYADQGCIYFSWDAASWHASKALYSRVEEINQLSGENFPKVMLAPLPSSAQFLNVIESVFSGMARAVIHNSDYPSVAACKKAINRHFAERNRDFRENPKRAGNKIWGHERTASQFDESNNCKDPRYR